MDRSYYRQRVRLIFLLLGVISSILWSATYLIYLQQREQMLNTHYQRIALESELLAAFLSDALLRHDYIEARQFLANWQGGNEAVTTLHVELASGQSLFHYRTEGTAPLGEVEQRHQIPYGDRSFTLTLGYDATAALMGLQHLGYQLAYFAAGLILLLGLTLWLVLFRWSVRPMEQELTRRTTALRRTIHYAHALLFGMDGHIAVIDENGRILDTNKAWRDFARANGYRGSSDMVGVCYFQSSDDLERIAGEGSEWERGVLAVLCGERESFSYDYPCHSESEQRWFLMRVAAVSFDGEQRAVIHHIDVTGMKQTEEALQQSKEELAALNRVYRALSATNKAVSQAEQEPLLLNEVARVIQEECGFPLVWIGYTDRWSKGEVTVQSITGQPHALAISPSECAAAHCLPTASAKQAVATGMPVIQPVTRELCQERSGASATDRNCWQDLQQGYQLRSSAAFPLLRGGVCLGAIVVYSDQEAPFVSTISQLLCELSNNLAFGILAIRERQARAEAIRELKRLAITDRLTQLYNRHKTDIFLAEEIRRAERYQVALSILLFDIDHFKKVNDRYGHPIGDQVLVRLAVIVRESLRSNDAAGRWGGEEFLVIAPHTRLNGARRLAEKLRHRIEQGNFGEGAPTITASFGVASWQYGDNIEALIGRADQALYQAKEAGRNRVVVAE